MDVNCAFERRIIGWNIELCLKTVIQRHLAIVPSSFGLFVIRNVGQTLLELVLWTRNFRPQMKIGVLNVDLKHRVTCPDIQFVPAKWWCFWLAHVWRRVQMYYSYCPSTVLIPTYNLVTVEQTVQWVGDGRRVLGVVLTPHRSVSQGWAGPSVLIPT